MLLFTVSFLLSRTAEDATLIDTYHDLDLLAALLTWRNFVNNDLTKLMILANLFSLALIKSYHNLLLVIFVCGILFSELSWDCALGFDQWLECAVCKANSYRERHYIIDDDTTVSRGFACQLSSHQRGSCSDGLVWVDHVYLDLLVIIVFEELLEEFADPRDASGAANEQDDVDLILAQLGVL